MRQPRRPLPEDYGLAPDDPSSKGSEERQRRAERLGCWTTAVVVGLFALVTTSVHVALLLFSWPLFVILLPYATKVWGELLDDPSKRQSHEAFRRDLAEYEEIQGRLRAEARMRESGFWTSLDGPSFEREIASLLTLLGISVSHVGGRGDRGIDLVIDDRVAVQCKQQAQPVSPAVAREVFGAMHAAGLREAILICPSGFTTGTKKFAKENGIELWDGDYLIGLARSLHTDTRLVEADEV